MHTNVPMDGIKFFFSTRTKGVSDLGFSILSLVPGGWGGIDPVGSEE